MVYIWMPEASGVWLWSRGGQWNSALHLEQLIHDLLLQKGEEATVFFPSRDTQILQQHMTKAQFKQLGADGAKYLLEEYVIQAIESLSVYTHFEQPNTLSVMGVAQHAQLNLQQALSLIPVKIVALLPDFMVLPIPAADQLYLVQIQGRTLIREHAYKGTSSDDLAVDLLQYINAQGQIEKTCLYAGLSDAQFEALADFSTTETRQSFDYQLPEIKRAKQHPYNILPKQKSSTERQMGYWKACAAVCVALLLTQFSYDALRWVKLKKNADQTAEIAIAQFSGWFGANSQLTEESIRRQFKTKLDLSQSANTQAIELLSRLGPILMQNKIIAKTLQYEANVINMNLISNNAESLQNLVKQLNQQGFKAELGNIQTQGESVVGMVKIQ